MPDKERSLVQNAASEKQVKSAGHKERLREKDEKKDLQAMLATLEGRRVFWRVLTQCKVYESIWEGSARIHYKAGQQDLGHWLMDEIIQANPDAYLQMQKEAMELNKGV